ncbi:MAG: hypothetical protein QG594_389 [Bacteroidota bacterium]|nr:hypothetical protein [Bacteroidota bacterium]
MKKVLLFLAILSLGSCQKKVYLTGSLMHEIQEQDLDIPRIQFYNDNPLYLEREIPASEANIQSGKVVFKSGRYIQRISLEKNTPGVIQREENGHFLVSFVKNSQDSELRFAPIPGEKGEFFYQLVDKTGNPLFSRLDYEGNRYLVIYKKSRVRLMLSKKVFNKLKIKVTTLGGNTVGK